MVKDQVGTWYVKAVIPGNENYAGAEATGSFMISKSADMVVNASDFNGVYSGEPQSISVSVTKPQSGYKIQYGENADGPFRDEPYAYTDVGEHTVYYQVTHEGYETVTGSSQVKITKALNEGAYVSLKGWSQGDERNIPTVTASFGAEDATYSYSSSENGPFGSYEDIVKDQPGNWYVKATITGTDNYEGTEAIAMFTISAKSSPGGGSGGDSTYDPIPPIIAEIKALPEDITISDKAAVEKAQKDYDRLSESQKKDPRFTEEIMKKLADALDKLAELENAEARKNQMGEDGTALGKGASAEAAEAAILGMTSDTDPAGSKIMPLKLRSIKQAKKSIKLKWNKPTGAVKFVLYGNMCNSKGKIRKMKRIKTLTGNTLNVKKLASGKKLKKGTYHKFILVALDADDNVVSASKVIHVTTKGGKVGNPKRVKVNSPKKLKKTLKAGRTFRIKAKQIDPKKLTVKRHIKVNGKRTPFRYESSNPAVATVTKTGKITAVSAGTANIIVYAQNGIGKIVKVTVN